MNWHKSVLHSQVQIGILRLTRFPDQVGPMKTLPFHARNFCKRYSKNSVNLNKHNWYS